MRRAARSSEELLRVLGRDRLADEVALDLVAAVRVEERAVLGRLDALGDDLEVQAVAERDDRLGDEALVRAAARGVAHERSVDLERRDRQALQVRQARIAGAASVMKRSG